MIYKIANTIEEYEQIFKLNYETFVNEIPQHEENETRKLKDKFHDKNIYIIAKKYNEVVAMISLCSERPFSLDIKLGSIDDYYKKGYKSPIEIRLLSVKPKYRKTKVFFELIQRAINYINQHSHDIIFISGTTRQEKLYRHLGFERFHENVGTEDAEYIPMVLELSRDNKVLKKLLECKKINFLPGPVDLSDAVKKSLLKGLYSHRSNEFVNLTLETMNKIKNLLGTKKAVILHGSATLANEAVIAQLKQRQLNKGIVLTNGEFGNRLVHQTKKQGLDIIEYSVEFGESFNLNDVETLISENSFDFIYLTHNETSVGILNKVKEITKLAKKYNLVIAIDAVSAVGAIKYNYSDVDYVTCSSGKALCSVAGLSIVGFNCELYSLENSSIYLDLAYAYKMNSIPFTQPSVLMEALNVALDKFKTDDVYNKIRERYDYMRLKLKESGYKIMKINKDEVSPVIITVELPKEVSSTNIGESLAINNIFIHYKSSYLQARNIIQFSFINCNTNKEEIDETLNIINEMIGDKNERI